MASIPTPSLSHLTARDYETVYEPAEDSFLLLDALEKELELITSRKPLLCIEVGGGSGVISTALSLQVPSCQFLVTDVNPAACAAITETARHNHTSLQVVRTSIVECLDRLRGKVDVLLCNPPYVATDADEVGQCDISAAWAGGRDGNTLTDSLISQLDGLLSPAGLAYLVLEQCNRPDQVIGRVRGQGLGCRKVLERRAGRELLTVVRIDREA